MRCDFSRNPIKILTKNDFFGYEEILGNQKELKRKNIYNNSPAIYTYNRFINIRICIIFFQTIIVTNIW